MTETETILAQVLYDLREKTEFTSGEKLHKFFADQLGEPSLKIQVLEITERMADMQKSLDELTEYIQSLALIGERTEFPGGAE